MEVKRLLKKLISIDTVDGKNGEQVIESVLSFLDKRKCGYEYEVVEHKGIKNLVVFNAKKANVLHAHYDVVPAESKEWSTDPFEAVEKDGKLYGRGACDDKSSVSAFADAFARASKQGIPAMLMLVGDEETDDLSTRFLIKKFRKRIAKALVGEPICREVMGDTIMKGRRGVLWLDAEIIGKPGHASRPEQALNPIEGALRLIDFLKTYAHPYNPSMVPTSCVMTSIKADGGATNVIPSKAEVRVDVRYNVALDTKRFLEDVKSFMRSLGFLLKLRVIQNFQPFLNKDKELEYKLCRTVKQVTGNHPTMSTEGGSSDAGSFHAFNIPVLEFGVVHNNIHGIDEFVCIDDVEMLSGVAFEFLKF